MNRGLRTFGAVAMACFVATATALAEGEGKGQGKGDGRARTERKDCGVELVVVLPDGTKRQYVPADALLTAFPAVQINQGERPRSAVKVTTLLESFDAAWVEVLDCDNQSVRLPTGLPFEGGEYLVVTGRGAMKVVREVQRGRYTNLAQGIRKLTLHAPAEAGKKP